MTECSESLQVAVMKARERESSLMGRERLMRVVTVVVALALMAECGANGYAAPAAQGRVQTGPGAATESARQLMKDVIYNELHDREKDSFWEYRSHLVTDKKNELREQIETPAGPVYEVLTRDGKPLTGAQAAQEKERLAGVLADPAKMRKVEQEHEKDEARLGKVMALIPRAYVFHYIGVKTGDRVVLDFAPDPKFVPNSYMDRIMYGLSGRVVVNQRLKRMILMDGRIAQKINFGFGLLGYVEPGGTFRIHRTQVSQKHWKTDLVAVNVHGRILLFSDVSQQEKETRWGFAPVPHDITLAEAGSELKQDALGFQASAESAADTAGDGAILVEGRRQR